MAKPESMTTTVSTKGQVILPKAIRDRREWEAGTRLLVEETSEGVLLKRAPAFPATRPEDVFAMLPHRGPPKSVEEMDAIFEPMETAPDSTYASPKAEGHIEG